MADHSKKVAVPGKRPEPVEERPFVGTTSAEEYPEEDRAAVRSDSDMEDSATIDRKPLDRSGAGEIDDGGISSVGATHPANDGQNG